MSGEQTLLNIGMGTISGRVLLVDDSQMVRMLVAKYLKRFGAEVAEAENGKDAINEMIRAKIGNKPFDLVIMDCQMPVMDGYEAVAQMRKSQFTTPIVALTGNTLAEDKANCLAAGFTDFLPKPVGAYEFFLLLKKYLQFSDSCSINAA